VETLAIIVLTVAALGVGVIAARGRRSAAELPWAIAVVVAFAAHALAGSVGQGSTFAAVLLPSAYLVGPALAGYSYALAGRKPAVAPSDALHLLPALVWLALILFVPVVRERLLVPVRPAGPAQALLAPPCIEMAASRPPPPVADAFPLHLVFDALSVVSALGYGALAFVRLGRARSSRADTDDRRARLLRALIAFQAITFSAAVTAALVVPRLTEVHPATLRLVRHAPSALVLLAFVGYAAVRRRARDRSSVGASGIGQ